MERELIIKKLEQYKRVPGHERNYENMPTEQLEKFLKITESAFEDFFENET